MTSMGKVQIDFIGNVTGLAKGSKDARVVLERFTGQVTELKKETKDLTQETKKQEKEVSRLAKTWDVLTKKRMESVSKFLKKGTLIGVGLGVGGAVAGGFGVKALFNEVAEIAADVDQVGKLADRLEMPVEELSALEFVAGESAVSFEHFSKAVARAAQEMAKAAEKGQTFVKVGNEVVRITDQEGKVRSITELLPELAKGIQSAGSAAEQIKLARKFFGDEGGDKFLTLLKESGDFTKRLAEGMAYAKRYNNVITREQFETLRAYGDAVWRLGRAWQGTKRELAVELAPAMTDIVEGLSLRIAQIPRAVKAAKAAIEAAAGEGEEAKKAGALLEAAGESISSGIVLGAKEGGWLFVNILWEGMKNVAYNAAIEFNDSLRMVLPDGLVDALGFDDRAGSPRKVQELEAQVAAVRDLYVEIEKVTAQLKPYENSEALRYSEPERYAHLREWLERAKSRLAEREDLASLEARLERARELVEWDKGIIAAERARNAQESFDRIDKLAAESGSRMRAALDQASDAWQALMDEYAPADATDSKKIAEDAFKVWVVQAELSGEQIWNGILAAFDSEKFQKKLVDMYKAGDKAAAKAIEDHEKMVEELEKEAEQIKRRLYPEYAAEQDIEALRELRAQLLLVGKGAEFTEHEMEAAIAKIITDLENPKDKIETFGSQLTEEIQSWGRDTADVFAQMAVDGEGSMDQLAKAWLRTMISMVTYQQIFGPLANGASNVFARLFQDSGWFNARAAGTAPAHAPGFVGPTYPGQTYGVADRLASGGPVDAGKFYMVGEQGPELVRFGQDGFVFPHGAAIMGGGGGLQVNVIDQRSGGERPQVTEQRGPDGRRILQVLIRDEVKTAVQDGSLDRVMGTAYGLNRKARA